MSRGAARTTRSIVSLASGGQNKLLSIRSIKPNPNQPRRHFDEEDLQSLASSLGHDGQITSILVRRLPDGNYEIIAGERRWRALKSSGAQRIAATVLDLSAAAEERGMSEDDLAFEIAVIENNQRKDLTAIERARTMAKLRAMGRSDDTIARMFGIKPFWVTRMIALTDLDSRVQKLMDPKLPDDQRLRHTTALALIGLTPDKQYETAVRAVQKRESLKEVRHRVNQLAQRGHRRKDVRGRVPYDDRRQLLAFAGRVSRELQLWLSRSDAELERIMERLISAERNELIRSIAIVAVAWGNLSKRFQTASDAKK